MAQPSPCKDGAIPLFCGAACCYFSRKEVLEDEVPRLGEKNVIKERTEYYLRNNPMTGACVFLDPTTSGCKIYDRRPRTCRSYDCRNDPRVDSLVAMIDSRNRNEKRIRGIVAELQAIAEAAYPNMELEEALELLSPEIYLTC